MNRLYVFTLAVTWLFTGVVNAQLTGLIPAAQQSKQDKFGNEWSLEQNGMITRRGGGNSILNGALALMIGTEQFYCNQPMSTPDGKETVLMGQQPMGGLTVTRYIRLLEKEGGMRFLEVFTNGSASDINVTVELRSNFNSEVRQFVTDKKRTISNGPLEDDETSIVISPKSGNMQSWFFTLAGARSALKPRIGAPNQYQVSFYYSLVVPAGGKASILHTVAQVKLPIRPDASDFEKSLKPFVLGRHLRDLPKGMPASVANLRAGKSGSAELAAWFPTEIMGISREAVDILALGEGTRLHGRASCARLVLQHEGRNLDIPWNQVIALRGAKNGVPQVWLKDGQLLQGKVSAEELKFVLTSGLQMDLQVTELDRLVIGDSGEPVSWPDGVDALVETWQGERYALQKSEGEEISLVSPWGLQKVKMKNITLLLPDEEDDKIGMVTLRDGSRVRARLTVDKPLVTQVALLGEKNIAMESLRALIAAPQKNSQLQGEGDDVTQGPALVEIDEPTVPFAELAGEQRLMTSIKPAPLSIITAGGIIKIQPDVMREMRNVTEEVSTANPDDGIWVQLDLWGGGSVMGQLQENLLYFQVQQQEWLIPAHEMIRVVNPTPKINENTLSRIGQLIRELGHDDWKLRERASGELKTLGELAKGSLKEAFKQTEDAEVKRRIESILSETE